MEEEDLRGLTPLFARAARVFGPRRRRALLRERTGSTRKPCHHTEANRHDIPA